MRTGHSFYVTVRGKTMNKGVPQPGTERTANTRIRPLPGISRRPALYGLDIGGEMNIQEKLFNAILDALECIEESTIGDGAFGIVFNQFPSKELKLMCAKLHRFKYDPREYKMLKYAHSLRLPVPMPLGEWPEYRVFAMSRVFGKNLEELAEMDLKFSGEMIESIMQAAQSVCSIIHHGDLLPRNVMIDKPVVDNWMVIDGTPVIVDFGKSSILPKRAALSMEPDFLGLWLKTKADGYRDRIYA